jgi:hydrogenase maturation protein HypF
MTASAWIVAASHACCDGARYAPLPAALPESATGILATGGHLKNTVALSVGSEAFISQHIGDLETAEAMDAFERVIADFLRLYETAPAAIAHDLHPDYASTRWALERAAGETIRLCAVQHHHAHLPPASPTTVWPGPRWASSGMGPAMGPMGQCGEANSCSAMQRASHASRICARFACRAATPLCMNRAAWRLRCCGSFWARRRWNAMILAQALRPAGPAGPNVAARPIVHHYQRRRLFDGVASPLGHTKPSPRGEAAMALSSAPIATSNRPIHCPEGSRPIV